MGRSRADQLDRLADEVARGQRTLGSIRDRELRESVRVALRLHADTPSAPDAYTRMRMRARVLTGLDPRGRGARDIAWTLRDIAWTALAQLARPAPLLIRGIALGVLVFSLGLGMTAASADTLPNDLLYPVKLASEQVRLVLATSADDRAMVELTIAEHRLAEAERLAAQGRAAEALIASVVYTQHVAAAAADLAPTATVVLAQDLERSFTEQRARAESLATTLRAAPASASAASVLAIIAAPTVVPAADPVQRVAETAANVASELAAAAERSVAPQTAPASRPASDAPAAVRSVPSASASSAVSSRPRETAAAGPSARSDVRTRDASPSATASPTGPPRERERHGSDTASAARRAADAAREAADRVRQWVNDNGPRGDRGRANEHGRDD